MRALLVAQVSHSQRSVEHEATKHTCMLVCNQHFRKADSVLRCMPNDLAIEKSDLLLKLGAIVERVRPAPIVDPNQFVNLARTRAKEHTDDPKKPGRGLFADQFETEANWHAHFTGTGPEIYEQTGGFIDAFVSGAGTGGTISGVALFLKSKLPDLKVVLADPPGSGLLNKVKYGVMFDAMEREGTRRRQHVDTIVEGIGINRVTHNFEVGRELINDAIRVTDDQAIGMGRWLVENDGIFVGSSSAVNCKASLSIFPKQDLIHSRRRCSKVGEAARSWPSNCHIVMRQVRFTRTGKLEF